MAPRIVILGGGTGGTLTANRLRRHFGTDVDITVVDQDDRHVYQPGLLFVPFGLTHPEDIVRPRQRQLHERHRLPSRRPSTASTSTPSRSTSTTAPCSTTTCLFVATGARLRPRGDRGPDRSRVDGEGLHLLRPRGRRRARTSALGRTSTAGASSSTSSTCRSSARSPRSSSASWPTGTSASAASATRSSSPTSRRSTGRSPSRSPRRPSGHARGEGHRARHRVQHRRGRRRRRSPGRLRRAGGPLRPRRRHPAARRRRVRRPLPRPRRRAGLRAHRPAHAAVEGRSRTSSPSATPPTCPPRRPARSPTSRARCSSRTSPASSPGEPLDASYDGHANCFIETGFHKALLIDFNYDTEPVARALPRPPSAPPLLKESRLNHLGKLMFQWFYWHAPAAGPRHPRHRPRHADRGQGLATADRPAPDPTHTQGGRTMTTSTIAGVDVDRQRRGLLRATRPVDRGHGRRRSRRAEGIDELTDRHWQVIDFMRKEYFEKGTGPTVRMLGKTSGRPASRSSTSSSRRARPRWPPRSPASPSPAAASEPVHRRPIAAPCGTTKEPPWPTPSRRSRSSSPRDPSTGSTPG